MSTPEKPAPSPSKGAVFLRRLASTLALWAAVAIGLFASNPRFAWLAFFCVVFVLAWFGLREFFALAEKRGLACFRGLGIGAGLLLVTGSFLCWGRSLSLADFEVGFLAVVFLLLLVRQLAAKENPHGLAAIGVTLLGIVYVAWMLNFLVRLRFAPGDAGPLYVLYFIVVTKFSDAGAYAVGSLFGRHKMIPRVSPGKTWEGFAGAVAVSTGLSLLFAHLAGGRLPGMTLGHAAALGVLLSVSAVAGDLVESLFKREAGAKDSGSFFPGIGGVLDLLDSLLFNAPLMYLYWRCFLT